MIRVEGLVKEYKPIRAVDSVTFEVKKGEIFGLLGPNGAGKTTTIKILTTLTKPSSGKAFIMGIDVGEHPELVKLHIGVVPQENNLDRELTAYENMLIYGMLHNVKDLPSKIEDRLKMVDLWERRNEPVERLSGGMQRRLLIARALLPEPPILFLDEPTVGLDPQVRREIWDTIRRIKVQGRTILLTTHYIEEAEILCDRVGILSRGRLIALDTPKNLKAMVGEYVVEFSKKDGSIEWVICKDREEAHKVAMGINNSVTIRKSNLEDVFIKLTGERIEG
ncbi:MAG: ABC transporter ATP-binding protein [Deltaproteobacteria bacterium]|nr:MAG: ABC transporter ATP-binding protein [Deltaproteobacteria bacterium]